MKLNDYKNDLTNATKRTSEIVEKLSFAGIALIWILRLGEEGKDIHLNTDLIAPAGLLTLTLFLHLTQYFLKGLFLKWFYKEKAKSFKGNDEVPGSYNKTYQSIVGSIYVLKVVTLLLAYAGLLYYVVNTLFL